MARTTMLLRVCEIICADLWTSERRRITVTLHNTVVCYNDFTWEYTLFSLQAITLFFVFRCHDEPYCCRIRKGSPIFPPGVPDSHDISRGRLLQ